MNNTGLLFFRSWQCGNRERFLILGKSSQGSVVNIVIAGHPESCENMEERTMGPLWKRETRLP